MPSKYRWVIIGVLFTAYIASFMQRFSIGPLAPFLKQEMGLTSTQVGVLMSAAIFGYMLSTFPAGWWVDRIGVRRIMVGGEALGGVFMLAMFVVPSFEAAIVVMTISGFGCGCIFPSTSKGVIVWFPVKERAMAMGIKQTGANAGGMITSALLPWLGLSLGWRFGFLFLGIMAIAIALLSFALYKEPPVPAIVSSVRTGATADFAPQVTRRSVRHLLKDRGIWLTGFAGFAIGAVEFALAGHLVLYLTEALLFPVVTAAAIMALTQAGGILGKPGGGLLSDRLFNGSRRMIFMLWAIISAVVCLLLALLGANLSWALYPLLFILGMTAIGWGGIYLTMVAELAGAENTGTAVGIAGVISMVGFLIGPIVFGYLVDATRSYQLAWLSQTVFATLSAIALYFVKEGNRA